MLENLSALSLPNVDNDIGEEIHLNGQMPINQTAQACIISQLMLEESPQVGH